MRAKLAAALSAGLALLAGCSSDPAVIAGISDTEVTIRQAASTPASAVMAEASEGCALYGKTATPVSYTCSENGCRTKFHLFACTRPDLAGTPAPLIDTGGTSRTTAAILVPESPRPATVDAAAPASDDFWNRPLERPVVVRGAEPAAAPVEPPPAADFFADACSQYLNDQAMHLRCQMVTGPDRDEYVPPSGWSVPLADQMRCHPLREDPVGYETCLNRRS